jgi:hypothetical protein
VLGSNDCHRLSFLILGAVVAMSDGNDILTISVARIYEITTDYSVSTNIDLDLYWSASAICLVRTESLSSRSAIVRASLMMRCTILGESVRRLAACLMRVDVSSSRFMYCWISLLHM